MLSKNRVFLVLFVQFIGFGEMLGWKTGKAIRPKTGLQSRRQNNIQITLLCEQLLNLKTASLWDFGISGF